MVGPSPWTISKLGHCQVPEIGRNFWKIPSSMVSPMGPSQAAFLLSKRWHWKGTLFFLRWRKPQRAKSSPLPGHLSLPVHSLSLWEAVEYIAQTAENNFDQKFTACLYFLPFFFFLPKPALLSSMWNTDRFASWVHTFWNWWNGVWVLIAVFEWAAGQRSECYLLFMLSVSLKKWERSPEG